MNKHENIGKKLTKSFFKVTAITAVAAVVGLIALIVILNRYDYALTNYGFAQGDIGKALFEFADMRSSLRAAIGYDDQATIDSAVQQHSESKTMFEKYFADVEKTIVSSDGRKTYDAIAAELEDYWTLDNQIMEIGASVDRERCRQAQEIAIDKLAPAYTSIYTKLEELMNVKVNQGNSLSSVLMIVGCVLAVVIVVVIAVAMLLSTRIGRKISKSISEPLEMLGGRLKTFASGDLSSSFPVIETGDEVEHMGRDAIEMADNLNVIIRDIDRILGEMANGNYAVKSNAGDKYTNDFETLRLSMRKLRDKTTDTLLSIGDASNQVSIGSGDLAKAAQCLAEGATEQTHAVQELHSTISDITQTMAKSAENAEESYEKAEHYANQADNSREEMNTMMIAMERINDASTRIGNIISEIESIASQTNLLSLNASIEAARAGESGRGFAVVADQIRELATQSAQAAIDSRELIEASIREVTEGNHAAQRASDAIESVVDGIKQIAEFSKNLKVMVEDQAEAMKNAEKGVNQIASVVESNAATAEEASATSEELFVQTNLLDELVGQFTLNKH